MNFIALASLRNGRSVSPLARLACQALVILALSGCATPARTVGLAIGAAIVAGAVANHNHDSAARVDVLTPSNPCATNPERCR